MKKVLSLLFLSSILIGTAGYCNPLGGMDPGVINTQYMKDIRTFDARMRNSQQKSSIIQSNKSDKQEAAAPVETPADIKSIIFVNNNNFNSAILSAYVSDYIDKPMTGENLAAIRKKIMKFYQAQGFYSAVATIVSENHKTGEIVIELNENVRNSVIVE